MLLDLDDLAEEYMRDANAAQALVVGDSLAEGTAELWAWAVGPEDLSLSTLSRWTERDAVSAKSSDREVRR